MSAARAEPWLSARLQQVHGLVRAVLRLDQHAARPQPARQLDFGVFVAAVRRQAIIAFRDFGLRIGQAQSPRSIM